MESPGKIYETINKMDLNYLPIEKTVSLDLNYPSVSNRYFSHHYFIPKNIKKKTAYKPLLKPFEVKKTTENFEDKKTTENFEDKKTTENDLNTIELEKAMNDTGFVPNGEDTCIMMHSNRICVVTLSPRHPVIVHNKVVIEVNFDIDGINRLSNKVSGKGKRGAQIVGLFSPLCQIKCSDESSYTVSAGVRGKLIEVNERLLQHPNLISTAPMAEGYLGIVLPKLNQSDNLKSILISPTQYEEIYSEDMS